MAVKSFDEIVATLSAEEKALLDKTLTKAPELKEGWLRQDDYSRKLNEIKSQEAKMAEDRDYAEKMRAWADVNVPRYDALVEKGIIDKDTGEETWTSQKTDLENQLAEARKAAVGGTDMKAEEVDERVRAIVKEAGVLSKDEINALYASEAKKVAEETFNAKYAAKETEFNEKTIPFVTSFATSFALAVNRYEKETGKEFTAEDQKKVYENMSASKNFDPREMVAAYGKPHIDAKTSEEEIERRAQAKADAIIKSRGGMPGGGNEPYIPTSEQKGSIQLMLERSAEANGDVESLVMAGAAKGAAELMAAGK